METLAHFLIPNSIRFGNKQMTTLATRIAGIVTSSRLFTLILRLLLFSLLNGKLGFLTLPPHRQITTALLIFSIKVKSCDYFQYASLLPLFCAARVFSFSLYKINCVRLVRYKIPRISETDVCIAILHLYINVNFKRNYYYHYHYYCYYNYHNYYYYY